MRNTFKIEAMATAEEGGSPSNNVASSYGGGGAGGKFRKKPFRKQSTPYDRPPTAYRGTNSSSNTGSWMTKLFVDPASKLISYGANRFFASLFRKRLPAPPSLQPPDVVNDVSEGAQGAVSNVLESAQEPAGGESSVPTNSRSKGVDELEQLLKTKTFSRSEIAHLTKLLQTKAVEVSAGDNGQKNETTALDVERHERIASTPLEGNGHEGIRSSVDISTRVLNSKVLEDDIATPAELAKAYMGSRPSKGSSSVLAIRHQGGMEDTGLQSNRPFTPNMPITSFTKKTPVSLATPDNGFITPRSRGRSALYNMARAPYSRVHSTSIFKGRSNNGGNTGWPSLSSSTLSPAAAEEKFESLPMTLKRRSSVLDDEIGSIGSIRRTRQKSNLLSPKIPETTHGLVLGSHAKQKLQLIGEPSHKGLQAFGETQNESAPISSHARVPSKSSEVAARIFQHLEKLTPKEKSSESKLVAAREKSPMKLTSGMLSGQGLRSMEDVNSSKFLMGDPHDHKLGDGSVASLHDTRDCSSQKPRSIEENAPKESAAPSGTGNPVIKNDFAGSLKASVAATKTDFVENGVAQPPPKKRSFRMSAREDSVELDEEVHSNGLVPTLSSGKTGTPEAPRTDSNPAPAEVPKSLGATTPSEEATVVSQSLIPAFSVATSDKPVESTSFPVFSFSSKVADKLPALSSESNKKTDSGAESSSSLFNISASTGSQLKIPEFGKSVHPSHPEAGDANNKSDAVPSVKGPYVSSFSPAPTTEVSDHINQTSTGSSLMFPSTTSVSNPVSTGTGASSSATASGSIFGLSAKPSNLSGSIFKFGASVDPTTSVPASSPSKISELAEEKTKVDMKPSSGNSPNPTIAAPPPANPESSTFGLGSSVSHSAVTLQGSLFGSASKPVSSVSQDTSLPLVPSTSSPGTVSQGASVLPVSSTSSPLFNTNGNTSASLFFNPQSLNPSGSGSTSSVFKFGSSPASEGNAVSSSSASTPGIFSFGFGSSSSAASSATLPKFNFGSNSSVPVGSSSTGNSNIFNFGGNSSTSSTVNTAGSNTAPNVLSSTWQSIPSPIFGSGSTVSPSTGFSFSALSTSSAATNTASVFGSISTASPSTGFSFGASSTSSAATNTVPVFGSSSTASPATGFSFGASSTSSAPTFSAAGAMPSPFSFTGASATVSSAPSLPTNQPVFGNPLSSAFGSSPGNNEQMNAEDSMAEDPVQSSAPIFGQSPVSPAPPGFGFGSTVPSQPNPFMFGSQQNQAAPQNPSPFQASGSLEFNAGGSFSLGSGGGGDKSGRRIVKINRNKNKRR